jgi:periplasmic copper chaperone A
LYRRDIIPYGVIDAPYHAPLEGKSDDAGKEALGHAVSHIYPARVSPFSDAWSRATPGGAKTGSGYLTIENKGSARLIGGSADVADKVQVHEMTMNNGVMTMRPLDQGLSIEPGKTVKLAPGGYHPMLFDLKSPLRQGDKVPVTLEFEKAGKVKLTLDVQGVGAQGPTTTSSSRSKKDMKGMPPGMKM